MKFNDLVWLCESEEIQVEKEYWETGKIKEIRYFLNKQPIGGYYDYVYHNTDGPAHVGVHKNGNVSYRTWFLNGTEHNNLNQPSYLQYSPDGDLEWEEYKVNGKLHRTNGPALQKFTPAYESITEYWINGVEYTKEEYDNYFKGLENKEDIEMLSDLGQTFE